MPCHGDARLPLLNTHAGSVNFGLNKKNAGNSTKHHEKDTHSHVSGKQSVLLRQPFGYSKLKGGWVIKIPYSTLFHSRCCCTADTEIFVVFILTSGASSDNIFLNITFLLHWFKCEYPKQNCCYFDRIYVTGCSESFHLTIPSTASDENFIIMVKLLVEFHWDQIRQSWQPGKLPTWLIEIIKIRFK